MAKPFGCPWKPPTPCVKRRPPVEPGRKKAKVYGKIQEYYVSVFSL
jgi:hypothetical protein